MATTQNTITGPVPLIAASAATDVSVKRLRKLIATNQLRAFVKKYDGRRTLLVDPSDVRTAEANSLVQYVPPSQKTGTDGRKKSARQKHPVANRELHPAAAAMSR